MAEHTHRHSSFSIPTARTEELLENTDHRRSNASVAEQMREGVSPPWKSVSSGPAASNEGMTNIESQLQADPFLLDGDQAELGPLLSAYEHEFETQNDPEEKLNLFETMHQIRVRLAADELEQSDAFPAGDPSRGALLDTAFGELNSRMGEPRLEANWLREQGDFTAADVDALDQRKEHELWLEEAYGLEIWGQVGTRQDVEQGRRVWSSNDLEVLEGLLRRAPASDVEENPGFRQVHRLERMLRGYDGPEVSALASMSERDGTMTFYDAGWVDSAVLDRTEGGSGSGSRIAGPRRHCR